MLEPTEHSPTNGKGAPPSRGGAFPNGTNLAFVEELYTRWLADPSAVDEDWRAWFAALPPDGGFAARPQRGPSRPSRSLFHASATNGHANGRDGHALGEATLKQDQVDQLVRAYRVRGHLLADLDPLGLPRRPQPELESSYYGLTEEDLERTFSSQTIHGTESMTLGAILERLRNTYCRTIGVQFMHIDDLNVKNWLTERMESTENRLQLTREAQLRILTQLTDAVIFEEFLQKKYLGAKRFSLEGGESLIPLLDLAIEEAAEYGVREVVFGMAHRGRINVLANILDKRPADIFAEFEDQHPEAQIGRGDVKYHLGYSSDRVTASGRDVHLTLCFNPSHLEFVNPVALGRLRAKQDRWEDPERRGGMALLIHGDASFIGQGVVQESLNLSQLAGYRVGGTIHVIVNNQVGFTTSPHEGRSCDYATDIAKFLQVPIFHVNGEDPEAVAQVIRLALEFRHHFQRDVVIDMYCYRRYGHNEGDEPEFTQPQMYRAIKQRKSVRDGYLDRLLKLGEVTREEADEIAAERKQVLEEQLSAARDDDYETHSREVMGLGGVWEGYRGGLDSDVERTSTSLPEEEIARVIRATTDLPEGFTAHKKLERIFEQRREMADGDRGVDWATAELVAFGTLALAGHPVRLSGQDSRRGTFSQRHSVAYDFETGVPHMPLAHLAEDQASVEIWNSPLSEIAVMGFEYGYSMDTPAGLVLWEAQFGDFVNVAQPIIDQFLVSAEAKWNRLSGLVLLLPHGFEGQGPEHSSARLERFLALAAEDNLQVVQPTTPAQYFNVLRRQVLRPWRKPLIVMTPKSLLRHPRAVSTLEDLSYGRFRRLLWDERGTGFDPSHVELVLLCSGKVYYDLVERRERDGREDVAILRFEQLYPLAEKDIREALDRFPAGAPVRWVQEEPENMGAWPYLQTQARFHRHVLGDHPITGVHRRAAAVPATGSPAAHKLEQEALLEAAFARD